MPTARTDILADLSQPLPVFLEIEKTQFSRPLALLGPSLTPALR
jgi:hypothetical protein